MENDPHSPYLTRNYIDGWAKELSRNLLISHTIALEVIANHCGYAKWQHFLNSQYLPKIYHPYFPSETLKMLREELARWSETHLSRSLILNTKPNSAGRTIALLMKNEVERLSPDEIAYVSHVIRDGQSSLNTIEELSPYSIDIKLARIDPTLMSSILFAKLHGSHSFNTHIYDFRSSIRMYCRINIFNEEIQITVPEVDLLMPKSGKIIMKRKWFPQYISSYIRYTNKALTESEFYGEISFSKILNEFLASSTIIPGNIFEELISSGGIYTHSINRQKSAEIRFNF